MKPILFSTPMVQALLNTKPYTWPVKPIYDSKPFKGMTRRVIMSQPDKEDDCINYSTIEGYQTSPDQADVISAQDNKGETIILKPRYKKGDVLWVRETWVKGPTTDYDFYYRADCECQLDNTELVWKPSIFMPRKAARLFLEIKSVRIERLKKITPEDCVNEGGVKKPHYMTYGGEKCLAIHGRYIKEFAELWDSINKKRGYSWESNPWVWVYTFMRVESREG